MTAMNQVKSRSPLCLLLAGIFCASTAQAAASSLPESSIDLRNIGTNQCRDVEWRLPHVSMQVVICHLPVTAAGTISPEHPAVKVDAAELRRQALTWREKAVNEALASGIETMQLTLDALPQRSLHPDWQVFIKQGIWGCIPTTKIGNLDFRFIDPCNQNRYAADGRALDKGYPSLSIPPYVIQANQLILGRLPTSLSKPDALPEVSFTTPASSSPAEQLVRAARWGNIPRASELIKAGTGINSAIEGGKNALLEAVQMRQHEMVAFLLAQGADANSTYPDGLTALDMARIVTAPELESMLKKAGATMRQNNSHGQKQ
jgi:hypothetical protein